MTPAEQIALVRRWISGYYGDVEPAVLAVCDLAERALLTDDEAEAVRHHVLYEANATIEAVLRRLLGDTP